MTTRRIVPAEATEEMLLQGMIAKAAKAEEIDGPITPLPTDREPTVDEVGDYCTRTALRLSSNIEIEAIWSAMLDASPTSGKVTEAEVEKAAKAMWERCADDMTWEEAKADPTCEALVEWTIGDARAALASIGLEVLE